MYDRCMTQPTDCDTKTPLHQERNAYGLAEYHDRRLCYPWTSDPAFLFWLPPAEGEGMAHWQDGRCGLCGFRDRLVEDHDHETGMVRGLLCRSCNTTDGRGDGHNLDKWRDGTTVASHMGIEKVYVSAFGDTPRRAVVSDEELDRIAAAMI